VMCALCCAGGLMTACLWFWCCVCADAEWHSALSAAGRARQAHERCVYNACMCAQCCSDAQPSAPSAAVFTTGAQKLFLLLQDALSDAPCDAVAKTHSLRTEVDVRFCVIINAKSLLN
jgi:hypothetical protein